MAYPFSSIVDESAEISPAKRWLAILRWEAPAGDFRNGPPWLLAPGTREFT
jgi:hypothetical protein